MKYQEIAENLKRKIQNLDSDLTSSDYYLINNDEELLKFFIKVYNDNSSAFDLDDFIFKINVGLILDLIKGEDLYRFFDNFIDYRFSHPEINLGDVFEVLNYVDEPYLNTINEKIDKKFRDPNFSPEIEILEEIFIDRLMDLKRYDILAKATNIYLGKYLSESLLKKIVNEFPFSLYPSSLIALREDVINEIGDLNKLTPTQLLAHFLNTRDNTEDDLINKLMDHLDEIDFNQFIGRNVPIILNYFGEEKINRILSSSVKKGSILCLKDAKDRGLVNAEDEVSIYLNHMKSGGKIDSGIHINDDAYIEQVILNAFSDKNMKDEFMHYMITSGSVFFLITNASKFKNILFEYKDLIAKNINNGIYDSKLEEIYYDLNDLPKEIIDAIFSTNKVKSMHLSCIKGNKDIYDAVLKCLSNNKGVRCFGNYAYSDIYGTDLLKAIIRNSDEISAKFSDFDENPKLVYELIDDIKNAITNNYTYSNKLLNENIDFVKQYGLLDIYLSNELLCEQLISAIKHHDDSIEYTSLYNEEVYSKSKDFFAEKFELNIEHMDILSKYFGYSIIKYYDNKQIQQILNLPDEEFNRVLMVFPKEEFNMVDLAASYDSIIEFSFEKNNPTVLTLFSNLIHAIDGKNKEEIVRLTNELIKNLDDKTVESVFSKYNLNPNQKKDVIYSLIINILSGDDKVYNTNILHELCNGYILFERKKYKNNYLFIDDINFLLGAYDEMKRAIESKDDVAAEHLMDELKKRISDEEFNEVAKKRDYDKYSLSSIHSLYYDACYYDDDSSKFLEFFKCLCDNALERIRKDNKNNLMERVLKLPYDLDEKSKETAIIKYIITNMDDFGIYNLVRSKLIEQGFSESLIKDCLNYYKDGVNSSLENDVKIVCSHLGAFVKCSKEIINSDEVSLFDSFREMKGIVKDLDENGKIKRNYRVDSPNIDIFRLLSEINVEQFKRGVLNNDDVYRCLLATMKKRKLHLLPDSLKVLFSKAKLSDDYTNLAGFVSYFASIYEMEKARLASEGKKIEEVTMSLPDILVNAEIYCAVSSVYSQILGSNDSKLIKANPGANSATRKLDVRMDEAVRLTIENFKRKDLTVPPVDRIFTNNDKKMRIIVGNFTDTTNLTHGERTGACMRIGGAGETLFNFCLSNENGFHVRFEDPDNGNYISRVSGFRNGNTVFLNELRYSCDKKKYTDDDVVEFCKIIANELIELSKNSSMPIENVVVHKDYAMKKGEVVDLEVKNIKEGLPGFYSDVNTSAVILATIEKERKFAKLNFDKSNVPKYLTQRGKIIETRDFSLTTNRVARIKAIKDLLSGIELSCIVPPELDNELLYSISSDDWFIYVDKTGRVIYDYIPLDKRAELELVANLIKVNEMLSELMKKDGIDYGLH